MDFRVAGPDDAEGVARAHVDGWQWGYRGLMPDAYLDGLDWTDRLDRWQATLRDPGPTRTHVAVADGRICGLVHSGPVRDNDLVPAAFHEVYSLYVSAQAAGRGAGARLPALGVGGAPPTSPGTVVWVLVGNARARTFYERHGFVLDGASKEYEWGGVSLSDVRMRRVPTPP